MRIVVINDASSKRISGFSKYFSVVVTLFLSDRFSSLYGVCLFQCISSQRIVAADQPKRTWLNANEEKKKILIYRFDTRCVRKSRYTTAALEIEECIRVRTTGTCGCE